MSRMNHATETPFLGDPFQLEALPLPRPADGYAVQYLGRDQLLDKQQAIFLPIRHPALRALHESFAAARQAALDWLHTQNVTSLPALAIVPAAFDKVSERHILIYGVLPEALEDWEVVQVTGGR
ncbi:hypothetical protein AGMMS49545_11100 [Betaproteobacteria bacterium]|nr:hypothetical protein AGMMS49545_11100 [Betaproteobacteria bacterium]GHU40076.1 hypothetical protein AGMMS50289_01090 [Betaproteobacteria bacterium]